MTQPHDLRKVAMAASLGVSVLMLVGKLGAYFLTGSSAILSDAAESVIHIVATGIAAFSLWLTTQPADPEHPYGHGKFAYFSAGFEGALILIASLSIIYLGAQALIVGPTLRSLDLGLAIIGALALVNLALGLFLIRVGKSNNALILVANGHHVLTDMWTSFGVVVGVLLVYLTGIQWLDPIVAILAGLNILQTAVRLLMTFFEGLMDKADPAHTQRITESLQQSEAEGLLASFHQLRHRRVNDQVHVEMHLLFPTDFTLAQAHLNASQVERRIRALFPQDKVLITSHMEPVDHEICHPGGHETFPDPFAS